MSGRVVVVTGASAGIGRAHRRVGQRRAHGSHGTVTAAGAGQGSDAGWCGGFCTPMVEMLIIG